MSRELTELFARCAFGMVVPDHVSDDVAELLEKLLVRINIVPRPHLCIATDNACAKLGVALLNNQAKFLAGGPLVTPVVGS